jgi:hypothetical protein
MLYCLYRCVLKAPEARRFSRECRADGGPSIQKCLESSSKKGHLNFLTAVFPGFPKNRSRRSAFHAGLDFQPTPFTSPHFPFLGIGEGRGFCHGSGGLRPGDLLKGIF